MSYPEVLRYAIMSEMPGGMILGRGGMMRLHRGWRRQRVWWRGRARDGYYLQ